MGMVMGMVMVMAGNGDGDAGDRWLSVGHGLCINCEFVTEDGYKLN